MLTFKEIINTYKNTKKSTLTVYLILRVLVILCMIREICMAEWNNAFLCLLSLILFTIPFNLQEKFKIKLPSVLEIIILCFIFSAEILGEINNFYGTIPYWDTILHTLNGFLAAGVGFSLIDLLNKNSKKIKLSPIFVAIVAFCFSMTIGVLWEFFEFSSDNILRTDMQKDKIVSDISTVELDPEKRNKVVKIENIKYTEIYHEDEKGNIVKTLVPDGYLDIGIRDTMKDLIVNFIGALCFSIVGYLYISNRDKYSFVKNFVPEKNK